MLYAIFIFCLIGCGMHSYYLGRRAGITNCIEHLEEQGYIEFTEEDETDVE